MRTNNKMKCLYFEFFSGNGLIQEVACWDDKENLTFEIWEKLSLSNGFAVFLGNTIGAGARQWMTETRRAKQHLASSQFHQFYGSTVDPCKPAPWPHSSFGVRELDKADVFQFRTTTCFVLFFTWHWKFFGVEHRNFLLGRCVINV